MAVVDKQGEDEELYMMMTQNTIVEPWSIILISLVVLLSLVISLMLCGSLVHFLHKFLRKRAANTSVAVAAAKSNERYMIRRAFIVPQKVHYCVEKMKSRSAARHQQMERMRRNGGSITGIILEDHPYQEPRPPSKPLGRIQLRIRYTQPLRAQEGSGQVYITLFCGRDLPPMDMGGNSDPYCKVILFPNFLKPICTKVIRKSLNPVWNETLSITIPRDLLQKQTILIYVLDHDYISKDDLIGEIQLEGHQLDLDEGETIWRDIEPSAGLRTNLGEVLVSLCYKAHTQCLQVNILKAKNIPIMDVTNSSDPYVKVSWMYKRSKRSERKTKVAKCNLNPVYNETFFFYMPMPMLQRSNILLTIKDYDRIGGNERIGYVCIGCSSRETSEKKQWLSMLQNTMHTVVEWHYIHNKNPV